MGEEGGSGQEKGGATSRAPCGLECGHHFHFVNLKPHSPKKWDLFYLESKFRM